MSDLSLSLHEPLTAVEAVDLAVLGEERGFDRVWFGELRGPDPLVCATAAAGRTRRIEFGTAVASYLARSPFSLAVSAASVSDLSGRAFHLGIGPGGKGVVEGWHRREFADPVSSGATALSAIREALDGAGDGPEVAWTRAQPVWTYLGALGPRMTEVALDLAHGLIAPFLTPSAVRDLVARAGSTARRGPARVCARLLVAVTDDLPGTRELFRRNLGFYLASPHYRAHFARLGFADEMADYLAARSRRDRDGAQRALTDELVDTLLIAGDPRTCRARVQEYRDAGAAEVLVSPYFELGRAVTTCTMQALSGRAAPGELRRPRPVPVPVATADRREPT